MTEIESNGGSYGWICPKCGRVYSPSTPICYSCGNLAVTIATGTSTNEAVSIDWTKQVTTTAKSINEGRKP